MLILRFSTLACLLHNINSFGYNNKSNLENFIFNLRQGVFFMTNDQQKNQIDWSGILLSALFGALSAAVAAFGAQLNSKDNKQ